MQQFQTSQLNVGFKPGKTNHASLQSKVSDIFNIFERSKLISSKNNSSDKKIIIKSKYIYYFYRCYLMNASYQKDPSTIVIEFPVEK